VLPRFKPQFLFCSSYALIAVALIIQSTPLAQAEDLATGELVIVVSALEGDVGVLKLALVNTAESFENDGEAFRSANVPIENGQASFTFGDLPFGSYGVKFYQDENENGKLDTNFVGFPKEAFGFSNDAMGRFGPPSFAQAKFEFTSDGQQIEIHAK
jgi:uncharacterized protein (DUF2141 family)